MNLEERLNTFLGKSPNVHETAFISANATIVGDVRVHAHASIWPQAVLRGDINFIEVGEGTNIQDGSIIHLADDYPTIIGKNVTVGHAAIVHACTIEDECLIGMHATILDGALIGKHCIIGAGALVTQNSVIPRRSMVLGIPGKVVRELTDKEVEAIRESARKYIVTAMAHKAKSHGN